MNRHEDIVPSSEIAKIDEIYGLMEHVLLLADEVALTPKGVSVDAVATTRMPEIEQLNDELDEFNEFVFCYSGDGYAPALSESDRVVTAYRRLQHAEGKFGKIYVSDSDTISHVIVSEATGEYRHNHDDLFDEDLAEGDRLLETTTQPPTGPRLLIDFLVDTRDDTVENISGSSVRAERLRVYNILDAAGLILESIDSSRATAIVRPEDVMEFIEEESDKLWRLIKSPNFHSYNAETQDRLLTNCLDGINASLQVNRLTAELSNVEKIFIGHPLSNDPSLMSSDVLPFQEIEVIEDLSDISVKPLRVDSLEAFRLSEHKRINWRSTLVDPKAGLCIVAEIDERTQEQLGVETSVIWLPISSQNLEGDFYRKRIGE